MELITIVQIMGVLLILVAVANLIPWRKIIERVFAPNPWRAIIYIETGEWTHAEYGVLGYVDKDGAGFYHYRWSGHPMTVAVPTDYGYKYLHGRRMIRVVGGNDRATYWSDMLPGTPGSGMALYAMVGADTAVKLALSVKSLKKALSWMMIVLVVAGAAIAYWVLTNNQAKTIPTPAAPASAQQTPAPNYQYPGGLPPGVLK